MVSATLTDQATADPAVPNPTSADLFYGFLILGLMGFGGVLPLARRSLVEKRRWLKPDEFVELLGLCQFLPGGNIINLAAVIGMRFRGPIGAGACVTGLLAAPTIIVVALGMVYDRFQDNIHVQHLFLGLAAAAAGLLVTLALKIVLPLRRRPAAIAVCAACVVAIAILKLPLLPTLLVLAPVSMALMWRFPA